MESEPKRNHKKQLLHTIMTMMIMIAITGVVMIARTSLNTDEWRSIPTISDHITEFEDQGFTEVEKNILVKLSNWTQLTDNSYEKEDDFHSIYIKYLKEYLSSNKVELGTYKTQEIEELIKGRNEVMYLEKENDINKMSYDARKVITYIYEQIYELCGLKVTYGAENDIEQIVNMSGDVIYQKNNQPIQSGFQIEALVITLASLLTLFGVCILITKKKQLLIKGGRYDGFDEKKYA